MKRFGARKPACRRFAGTFLLLGLIVCMQPLARGQVVINEIMYHPLETWPPIQPYKNTNLTEYVEIYNAGTAAVDLIDYREITLSAPTAAWPSPPDSVGAAAATGAN